MAVRFALPVAHRTDGNYGSFTGRIARGRPFRQPLETAPDPATSAGLELFLMPVDGVPALFALFDGELRFEPGGSGPHSLVLTPAPGLLRRGRAPRLRMVEAPPARIVYGNADEDGVEEALATLILDAYLVAAARPRRPAQWHPCMRLGVDEGTHSATLKRHLDDTPQAERELEIRRIAGELMTSSGQTVLADSVPVRAGDRIGAAAPYRQGDTPPPAAGSWDPKGPSDADRARRLTLEVWDDAEQAVDPVFHLHRLMALHLAQRTLPVASREVQSVTEVVSGAALAHPLVTVVPELAHAAAPRGRARVNGVSAFPLGDLIDFHGFPREAPVGLNEWRYADTRVIEAREREDPAAAVPLGHGQTQTQRVTTLWTTHGDALARIGDALQVPSELIVALACTEALSTLSERSVRLEPLQPADRALVRANAATAPLEAPYDKAVGVRGDVANLTDLGNGRTRLDIQLDQPREWARDVLAERLTWMLVGGQRKRIRENTAGAQPQAGYTLEIDTPDPPPDGEDPPDEAWVLEGYSPPHPGVPVPWPGGAAVRAGSTLTWTQLLSVVNVTGGSRVSPGLIQTLIQTARGIVMPWLRAALPTAFADLGIPPPPAAAGGYLNDWLIQGEHSLLMGAAYIRMAYNEHTTRFDLPLVGGAYNAGRPRAVPGSAWGLRYHGRYVERAGPFYNAAAAYFDGTPAPDPPASVRFQR